MEIDESTDSDEAMSDDSTRPQVGSPDEENKETEN